MNHLAEGARIIFGDRRYLRYVIVPWLWSTLIFLGVVVIGYFLMVPWLQDFLTTRFDPDKSSSGIWGVAVSLAYLVFWVFAAGFVFLTITSITSAFLWDDLSAKIEEQLTGVTAPKSTLPFGRVLSDSISRGVFAILIAIASLGCGWIIPIVGPVLLAGWVGLLDYTSPAFLRYDRTVGQQWPIATKMKGWFGFQVLSGFLTLVPFVNVLLLPVLVAGGTVMSVRSGALRKP